MAISDSAKVDLLYKKYFGVTKTDLPANKSPSNESISSPALLRGDIVWQQATSVPPTAAAVAGVVQAYQTTGRIECVADTTTTPISSVYPSWKTNLTDWIPPEFGSTYFVKVYAETTGNANPTTGTPLSDSGIAGVGEWNFDYSAGVLNFIGGTIPAALTVSKVVYITGYRYVGTKGVTNYPGGMTIGNITITGNTITGNTGVSFGGEITANVFNGNITSTGVNRLGNLSFTNGTISTLTTNGNIILDPNGTGNVNVSGAVVTNLGSPTGGTDAVTKNYVDSALAALSSSNINQQNSSVSVVDTGSNGNVIVNVDGSNIAYFSQTAFTVSNITLANNSIVSRSNVVNFPGTGAITLPSGNDSNRPAGVTGLFRFNTAGLAPEYYNGTTWVSVNNTVTDQSFSGDGSNLTYTLDQTASQAGILVSINGTLQQPGVAYTVSGNQITFAEIPLVSDVIDIRFLGALVNTSQLVDDLTVSGNIISGNIVPSANVTYSLGNITNQWRSLWVSSNTIYIGNVPLTVSNGSVLVNGVASYSNTNVAAYLTTATITTTGNVSASNITTSGNVSASGIGAFYAANRPAFRIVGNGGAITATANVTSSNFTVDYNQGSYLNTTTGFFTAPVAGLYQVNLLTRANSNTNGVIAQSVIQHNYSGGNQIAIMIEYGTNTSMNHTGGSTIVKMAVGDTLQMRVLVGTISFDGNDNWSVAYIG